MKWLILILGILSNASASVLIKVAMSSKEAPIQLSNPLSIIGNLPLVSGIALYGMAFILYALALTYLPLNIAHPILTSGSIALVSSASVLLFGENLSIINVAGIFFIIIGVWALTVN
ncbi:small multidrug resistance protein [Psychromonas ingrahamii 37]|uniref:Small multidrug resistance protein n=1 Tax=Psychromonas ingrahamii (strain DSM 17664 / CCUG 51855 / 37) TaxID=357804 RepID=A1SS44_PSYIN|nr:multidrug transporter [Psychromonas ingrahamii]ABM02309.1 small multidrug resistance protein [Psychromonas ingrahamii 37]